MVRRCRCNHCSYCLTYLANKKRAGTLGFRALTHEQRVEHGKRGGAACAAKHGPDHYRRIGVLANLVRWEHTDRTPRFCACGNELKRPQKWSCSGPCREERRRANPHNVPEYTPRAPRAVGAKAEPIIVPPLALACDYCKHWTGQCTLDAFLYCRPYNERRKYEPT